MSFPEFSYTNRDYESSRQEGISKIPIYSKGTWTDTNVSDPGVIILDYVHALVDMIQYYQDHNALEVYLSTAKERKNIFRIVKQLGYEIMSSKGSTVTVTFTTDRAYPTSYTIPKNTKLSTKGTPRIDYLTLEDTIVYSGKTSIDVPCVQGIAGNITYVGTGVSSLDSSLNPEDQYILLPVSGVDIDSITITDNSKDTWNKVDYVVLSNKDEKSFEPRLLYDGRVKIQFGSGERGYSPQTTDELYISYTYNIGSEGKVGVNELTIITLPQANTGKHPGIFCEDGTLVNDLKATNSQPSSGGYDPESSLDIVSKAPGVIKSNDRAVTLEDYESLAKRIPGVMDAKAYDIKTDPECLHYEVKVLIIPSPDETDENLKTTVYEYLKERSLPSIVLSIVVPVYHIVDITASVIIENNYYEEDVEYQINKVLKEYFNALATTMGGEINPNILHSIISKVVGVRYVERLDPSTVIQIPSKSIAKLGSVNLTLSRRSS